jgi:hypothetical protein
MWLRRNGYGHRRRWYALIATTDVRLTQTKPNPGDLRLRCKWTTDSDGDGTAGLQ